MCSGGFSMTIRVKIAEIEKDIADVEPSWINEQINRRRAAGETVCVQITIQKDSANIMLTTADCPHNRGGSKNSLSDHEKAILDLWMKLHLNESKFSGGNLLAFLNQIK